MFSKKPNHNRFFFFFLIKVDFFISNRNYGNFKFFEMQQIIQTVSQLVHNDIFIIPVQNDSTYVLLYRNFNVIQIPFLHQSICTDIF